MISRLKKVVTDLQRENYYRDALLKDDFYEPSEGALRMYVVVRSDILPPINQGIQALHAVTEFSFRNHTIETASRINAWALEHKTVVLLGADEETLAKIIRRAKRRKIEYEIFQEPDLENIVTAVAFVPMTAAEAKDLTFGYRRAE